MLPKKGIKSIFIWYVNAILEKLTEYLFQKAHHYLKGVLAFKNDYKNNSYKEIPPLLYFIEFDVLQDLKPITNDK